jgi:hypothetical protein
MLLIILTLIRAVGGEYVARKFGPGASHNSNDLKLCFYMYCNGSRTCQDCFIQESYSIYKLRKTLFIRDNLSKSKSNHLFLLAFSCIPHSLVAFVPNFALYPPAAAWRLPPPPENKSTHLAEGNT